MRVLILGANSDIGMALAHRFADSARADLYLASRDLEELGKNAADLTIRYNVRVETLYFDATQYDSHASFYKGLDPRPDVVIMAFGYLGDQVLGQREFAEAGKTIETNLTGAVSILEIVAADFEARKSGSIIILSSVAGERGRRANYLYGAAKAGLTTYAGGLRNRLSGSGVHVMTVLPGFVRTKMTASLKLPPSLTASPGQVAKDVYKAYSRRTDILYSKRSWRLIMFCIRAIPEGLFKKLNI